jgi:hypothetical protein
MILGSAFSQRKNHVFGGEKKVKHRSTFQEQSTVAVVGDGFHCQIAKKTHVFPTRRLREKGTCSKRSAILK